MSWSEFSSLLSSINSDTPLGNIVSIRSETDPKRIKEFSKDQRKIYNAWKHKNVKKLNEKEMMAVMDSFKNAFISLAGKG